MAAETCLFLKLGEKKDEQERGWGGSSAGKDLTWCVSWSSVPAPERRAGLDSASSCVMPVQGGPVAEEEYQRQTCGSQGLAGHPTAEFQASKRSLSHKRRWRHLEG